MFDASSLRAELRAACSLAEVRESDSHAEERLYLGTPAPNVIAWAADPQYLGLLEEDGVPSIYRYTRTYQVLRDLFQLRCPICNIGETPLDSPVTADGWEGQPGDCWNKTPEQLQAESLLEWNHAEQDDVCPQCATPRLELELDGLLQPINQLHLVCGMRAGKSVSAGAYIGTYVEHRLITLGLSHEKGLHGVLGMTLKDPFEMTFLASNDTQSKDTIWAKYRAARLASKWFQRYVPWVKAEEAQQHTPDGMRVWSYVENAKHILNEHPTLKLNINSLNSNSSGLVGRTRVAGFVDEIGRMLQTDSRMGADEIYRGVENSLQTVRSRGRAHTSIRWLGLMCSVTSPVAQHDKSMKMLRASGAIPGMLAYHYATWDFNPFEPRENFNAAFAKDPQGAQRDFGAKPPTAAFPLVADPVRFRESVIREGLEPTATFTQQMITDPDGKRYLALRYASAQYRRDWNRYVVYDAGKNFDAFAGSCAHGEWRQTEESRELITVFDWIIRIIPMKDTEVLFSSIPETLQKVKARMPIVRAEFDRWNSVQIIQNIRMLGIRAEQVSTKDEDYRKFMMDGYAGLIEMLPIPPHEYDDERGIWLVDPPELSPASAAIYELEGLEEDPDTHKITNPRKGLQRGWDSNDVAQTIVHVHKLVQSQGYTKKDNDRSRDAVAKRAEADMSTFMRMNQGVVMNPGKGIGGGQGRGW